MEGHHVIRRRQGFFVQCATGAVVAGPYTTYLRASREAYRLATLAHESRDRARDEAARLSARGER